MTAPTDGATRRPAEPGSAPVTVRLGGPSLTDDLSLIRSRLAECLLGGRTGVVVDVSAVDTLSSPTVAAILWARRSCAARRLPFSVIGFGGRDHRILRSCGLVDGKGREPW